MMTKEVEDILRSVCLSYGLSKSELMSKGLKRRIVRARRVAMVALYHRLEMTYVEIGDLFGMSFNTPSEARNEIEWLLTQTETEETSRIRKLVFGKSVDPKVARLAFGAGYAAGGGSGDNAALAQAFDRFMENEYEISSRSNV